MSIKLKISLWCAVAMGAVLGLQSCQDQVAGTAGAGNPEITAQIQLKATGMNTMARSLTAAADSDLHFMDQSGRHYRVQTAYLHLGAIKIEPMDNQKSNQMEIKTGPFLVDLKTSTTQPALPALKIPKGWYEGVELKLSPMKRESMITGLPSDLADATLYLQGTVDELDGQNKPFQVRIALTEDWIVGYQDSLLLDANSKLNIQFDLQSLGQKWDPGTCGQKGLLFVNSAGEGACAEAAQRFRDAFRQNSNCSKEW